jgi:hypothetical protein
MQNTKDSFFIALRDRLAALDPARTVTVLGVSRPAIIVPENEIAAAADPLPEAFYITFGVASVTAATDRLDHPLQQLACEIAYYTEGSSDLTNQDRGRALAGLDDELLSITSPANAALKDHSQSPAADLSANIFWTRPTLTAAKQVGNKLSRTATCTVFTYMEAAQ